MGYTHKVKCETDDFEWCILCYLLCGRVYWRDLYNDDAGSIFCGSASIEKYYSDPCYTVTKLKQFTGNT